MNSQLETTSEIALDHAALRDLLASEVVLIGGGETVVCGI